MKDEFL